MQRLLAVLIVALLGPFLSAQGRQASEATRIRSCPFDGGAAAETQGMVGTATESSFAAAPAKVTAQQDPAPAAPAAPKAKWQRPPDPVDPGAEPPHDLRRPLLRQRLDELDERYPWLAPAAPSQWLSLGLLLAILLVITVHVSARVAGAEHPSVGRSGAVAMWYLLTTLLQVAAVPVNDLAVCLMLLGNTTLALFWLRGLFGLTRIGALIAFAVQLGFVVIGYGALELVDSLLGSISSAHA